MNEYDDVFGTPEKEQTEAEPTSFDREEWIRQKRAEREHAYELMDQTAEMIARDPGRLMTYLDKKYYLLTTMIHSSSLLKRSGINLSLVCQQQTGRQNWKVYEVNANELNEAAAKFFLRIHYRLTDSPLEMMPIWPIHIETPYNIKFNKPEMIFHFSGRRQIIPKSYPKAGIIPITCPNEGSGQVIKVSCNSRQQLISAGSANVLEYLYLWKESLLDTYPETEIEVKDEKGDIVHDGKQADLPSGAMLQIKAPVDGIVRLLKKGFVVEKIPLPAKERIVVKDIHYGMTIQITQGLDIVWSYIYEKQKTKEVENDKWLYSKLISFKGNEIPVNHSLGGLAIRFKEYPLVKKWLTETITNGHAPINAIHFLKRYLHT